MQLSGGPVIHGGVRDLAAWPFSRECVRGRWREGVRGLSRSPFSQGCYSKIVGVFVIGFALAVGREAVKNLAL